MADRSFTTDDARSVGERLGVDWASGPFDLEQFREERRVDLRTGGAARR